MRTRYSILLFAIFGFIARTMAQETPDAYKDRVNYIFANVDHSKVSTGILSDYGLQVILPEYYDGTFRSVNVFPNWSPNSKHIVYGSGKLSRESARGRYQLFILKNVY